MENGHLAAATLDRGRETDLFQAALALKDEVAKGKTVSEMVKDFLSQFDVKVYEAAIAEDKSIIRQASTSASPAPSSSKRISKQWMIIRPLLFRLSLRPFAAKELKL